MLPRMMYQVKPLDRKIDCDTDGDNDSQSSTKSYLSMLSEETNRHKERLNRLRKKRSDISNQSFVRSMSSVSQDSFSSGISNVSRSSMLVRTSKESLNGGKIVEMRKKRRRRRLSASTERINNAQSSISSSSEQDINSLSSEKDINSSSSEQDTIVQFSRVMIREYPIIPGDNPAVSGGPPLMLDWTATKQISLTMDRFEYFRRGKRRQPSQMKIPKKMRMALLLEQEHDAEKISLATKEAAAIRHQRSQTIASLTLASAEESLESIRRRMFKPFRKKQNKEEEDMKRCMERLKYPILPSTCLQ